MIANLVTCFRILLIPLIIALLLYNQSLWAFVLFLLTALTDWLDGYLARRLNQVTDLGKFLDPLVDKLLVISILLVLVWVKNLDPIPLIIIILREAIITGLRIYKAKQGIAIPAIKLAKIKTVFQMIAVGMLILSIPYANAMLWLAVFVSIISGVEYARKI